MLCDLQKASFLKRISAWILDIILICIFATGSAFLISQITDFDGHIEQLQACYAKYETKYNIIFDLATDEYEKLTEDELMRREAAEKELSSDKEAQRLYSLLTSLTLLMTSLGLFSAFLILEFAVPLFLGNGQTVGKKIFGIGVMSAEGVKLSSVALFVRAILGKYTVETMIPTFIILMIGFGILGAFGTLTLAALFVFQLVLLIATRTNAAIHDVLSGTVAVDLNSQMIFPTREELISYKKAYAAEQASRSSD